MKKPKENRAKNERLIPPVPIPFDELMADVLKVKPPEKKSKKARKPKVIK